VKVKNKIFILLIIIIMIVSLMKIGSLLTALALPFTQKVALSRPEEITQVADKNFSLSR